MCQATNQVTAIEFHTALSFCFSYYCPMPQLTPENDRVIIFGYQTPDPTNFIAEDFFKVALMTLEILSREDYNLSTIFIFDFGNYRLGHVPKITLSLSKKCEICTMVSVTKTVYFLIKFPALAHKKWAQVVWIKISVLDKTLADLTERVLTHS